MRFNPISANFMETELPPHRDAVIGSDRRLSWEGLAQEAAAMQKKLADIGVGVGQPVVLYGHKEAGFISAICACMLNRSPWVPVDTIYPEGRMRRICELSRAAACLDVAKGCIKKFDKPADTVSASDLLYIIFTSGSTGEPKGVQIPRQAVNSLLNWMREEFDLPYPAVMMNQAPFSFDLSIYELMYSLSSGGTLVLNSRELIADQERFLDLQKEAGVNVWVSTPSFAWQQMLARKFCADYLDRLQVFLFCGEVLPGKLVRRLHRLFPHSRILNTYGPTEATVATTLVEITPEVANRYDPLPVGRPKPDCEILIDPENSEIIIVGDHVMQGYINRQDLNDSKMFMHNGRRAFRTGDCGEFQDEWLFCKGRLDDQIKMRGYRIELQEIEKALELIDGVTKAAVVAIANEGAVSRLVAYLKTTDVSQPDVPALVRVLSAHLPDYMIPGEFIAIEDFPYNTNHKIDRKALAAMWLTQQHG
jgi:D-alanine--poly(phosphoribitol) ligase subunit 1